MTGDGHGPSYRTKRQDRPYRQDRLYRPDESDRDGHGMGERQSGGKSGRRRAHPGDAPDLEALLAAAIRGHGGHDAEAEERAVNAFRTARDSGALLARTRRRDDWRPREQRRVVRSMKVTLSLFLASLTLGGVAVAAIGSYRSSSGSADDSERPGGTASATRGPETGSAPTASGAASVRPDRPVTAKDAEAHCRTYEQVKDRGQALDSTAWRRLVTEAGGEANVSAHCAGLLATATPTAHGTADGKPAKPEKTNNADVGEEKSDKAQETKQ